MEPIKRIGYIGMGIMGAPMALNLLKAGYEVTVWNRTASKCDPLVEAGAKVASSPAEMASSDVQAIFLNVTDTPDVEAVLFGEQGVSKTAQDGLIVIDNSTIKPLETQQFAARLQQQGVTMLDAPVSGGDIGARNGTLCVMVGGDEATFDRCKQLFDAIGKTILHVGESGMGQVCKACNQVSVVCNLLGTIEALALAEQCGLDPKKMAEVVSGGAGGSWQLANLGPRIVDGDHAPGFMIDLVLKDLAIVMDTARDKKLPLSTTGIAEGYFRSVAANGGGRLGTQAIATVMEKLGGFKFADDS